MTALTAGARVHWQVIPVITRARIDRAASAVVFVGALALIVDMFLGWVKVTVLASGALDIHMHVTGSGWAGWGIVGGIVAIVLLLWHADSLRRTASVKRAAVTAALAVATAGFTIAQAVTGEVDVGVDGTLFVTVTRQWPADTAIALSATIAVAAAIRLVAAVLDLHRRPAGRTSNGSVVTA
ncbi:MAG: hypothetical protein ACM3QU_12845 [Verrucomicrobiota bacterium]